MCMNLDSRRFPIHARYVVIFTSILLKNSSSLFSRIARFRSESGCKDKAFSRFPPNLSRSFFELFFRAPRLKVTRRERSSSTTPERHRHANSPSPRLAPPFRFSGCKDKAKIPPFPNFSTTFLSTFSINTGFQRVPGNVSRPRGVPGTGRERLYHTSTR